MLCFKVNAIIKVNLKVYFKGKVYCTFVQS